MYSTQALFSLLKTAKASLSDGSALMTLCLDTIEERFLMLSLNLAASSNLKDVDASAIFLWSVSSSFLYLPDNNKSKSATIDWYSS
jgi:hypothetical protein